MTSAQQRSRIRVREQARRRALVRRIRTVALIAVAVGAVALGGWLLSRDDDESSTPALSHLEAPDIHSLAFDLRDADTIYFGHHDGLSVSDDAGLTWRAGSLQGQDAMAQGIALGETPVHYIAGHEVFIRSHDGVSWAPVSNDLPSLDLHSFAVAPSDPNRLYAVPAGMGLFTSVDGGATWMVATVPAGPETQPIVLAVAPNEPRTLYLARNGNVAVSSDAGSNWQVMPGPGGMITAMAVAPDSDTTIYLGTNDGLYRRSASGTDWQRLPLTSEAIMAIAVSPAMPERVAVIDRTAAFYRSDDRGDSWVGR